MCRLSSLSSSVVAIEFPRKYTYLYLLSSHVSTFIHRISTVYCMQDSAGQTRQRVTRQRGTTTATGDKMTAARGRTATGEMMTATGDTTMARVSRVMGSTMTATGGTTMRHENSDAQHDDGNGQQDDRRYNDDNGRHNDGDGRRRRRAA